MGLFSLFKPARSVIVIDGVSLNESLGNKGKVPPRNQLQILRRLARFAQREKLDVVAVLTGTPLHKAPGNKKFEEVTVVYSKSPEEHARYTVNAARSRGSGAILVTGDPAVNKLAGRGIQTLRMSTFRKAFDVSGSDTETSERSPGNRSGGRKPRRRSQKPAPEANKKPEPPTRETSEADAINELIDLVD